MEPWLALSSSFAESMMAGAVAGFVCDLTLYPLDTLKTRLQAPGGLRGSGGLVGAYRGIGITLAGSVPCSALFFSTYESAVPCVDGVVASRCDAVEARHCLVNAIAAAIGEFVAATIRTPIEALKQRRQVNSEPPAATLLWRGWSATLLRDVPFSMVQYPLYHAAKRYCCSPSKGGIVEDPSRAALCGSLTSATAAALTTPFDVAQTRVMLADGERRSTFAIMRDLARARGVSALFAGAAPRSAWMGLGGLLFLGSYEHAKVLCRGTLHGCERQNPVC
ncbi:hypothetical protein CTAYLR_003858 [Chrysophaeum taylorii]|uniref:Mitochondrial carrier protein n=1 Tax=Chrysophaeum taylorii TaxID=2483200 RepID=A0AAD7XQ57_9STRA|nr:hypothetical protein CTAYLR_003858 [Chrysophaeum taylorii]